MPAAAAAPKGKTGGGKKKSGAHHAKRAAHAELKKGISKFSRSSGYFFKKQRAATPAVPKAAAKPGKAPRWYPAENIKRDRPRSAFRTWDAVNKKWVHKKHAVPLRSSITKGTVLILLAGKFRGKRVVFLKQLSSGLLLVTGPYKVNGVPLRRVNQAYVIATSTKIELPKIDVSKFDDAYFAKDKKKAAPKEEKKGVFADAAAGKKPKRDLPHHKMVDQKAVDKPLIQVLKKTAYLKAYLRTGFALQKGQYPHRMNF